MCRKAKVILDLPLTPDEELSGGIVVGKAIYAFV